MQPRWMSDVLNLWQNEKLSWTHTACFFILHLRFGRFSCVFLFFVFFSLLLYPILLASLLAQKCFCPCTLRLFMPTSLRNDGKKTNIYMYKVMYTIYSNTFQNRQTLKSLAKISLYFFSTHKVSLSRLYNLCIYE